MSTIHVLDTATVNKIAAGEVVERPASVIKELIENSLDAGASRVEVEIMAGGTSLMRVTDDGCGMSREDAALALERHATSKIAAADDLMDLGTLGFRGEALPTIASVSRFSLVTRRAGEELGTKLTVTGGEKAPAEDVGCKLGTTIKVEDLFFNTPARKKFMKTVHTEGSHISDCVTKQALANPEVAFRFINGGKTVLSTPGSGGLKTAIRSVYGGAVEDSLLPLSFQDEDLTIDGFLTKPSMLRSSRGWQTFIVNGRLIESPAIAKAIENAYRSLVPRMGYPLAVLHITVPPRTVDINVHPRKTEIKFEDEGRIFKGVYKAVIDAIRPVGQRLEEVAAVPAVPRAAVSAEPMPLPMTSPAGPPASFGPSATAPPSPEPRFAPSGGSGRAAGGFGGAGRSGSFAAPRDMTQFAAAQAAIQQEKAAPSAYGPPPERPGQVAEPPASFGTAGQEVPAEAALSMVPIGQVARCYIVAQDGDTLYIVDQHAAHERILYDRFAAQAEEIPSQQLLVHLLLDFSPAEAELLEKHRALFFGLGFDMEASGPSQVRLKSVPADIPVGEAEDVLREILGALVERHDCSAAEIRHACLAMTACKAAIKHGDELNLRQMQIVLDELRQTARPYTCPHGRPTILRFTDSDLAKMFKRT